MVRNESFRSRISLPRGVVAVLVATILRNAPGVVNFSRENLPTQENGVTRMYRHAVVFGAVTVTLLVSVSTAYGAPVLRARALRIPRSTFPSGALVAIDRVESNAAIMAQRRGQKGGTYLPTWFFSDTPGRLGRITGYAQVASWSVAGSAWYFSVLSSVYPSVAAAEYAHFEAVADVQQLRTRGREVDVSAHFRSIGDERDVVRFVTTSASAVFDFYLMTFTRGRLEFEIALALPATQRDQARRELVGLGKAADKRARRALTSVR